MVDVGGVPNLMPLADRKKLYDFKTFPGMTGMKGKDEFIIGAGAAPWTYLQRNGEVI